jgi:hypothetical protein
MASAGYTATTDVPACLLYKVKLCETRVAAISATLVCPKILILQTDRAQVVFAILYTQLYRALVPPRAPVQDLMAAYPSYRRECMNQSPGQIYCTNA